MIIPNLMVRDLGRAIAFYRDVIGLKLTLTVGADRSVAMGEIADDAVFATLEGHGGQLMLQTEDSLGAELAPLAGGLPPRRSGTIYFRDVDPAILDGKAVERLKAPETTWYGMREAYVADPDGHIICLGAPDGSFQG